MQVVVIWRYCTTTWKIWLTPQWSDFPSTY